ncbi:MAG: VanZ family protein [Thermoflexus sp.]|nr:VanZ family protein [Thermoflexus sp.]
MDGRDRWSRILNAPAAVRWGMTLLWMGVIFLLSSQPHLPQAPEPWLDALLKNIAHGLEYAILAVLTRWTLRGHGLAHADRWAWGWAVLYGLTDEAHQALVPGRHPSGWDVLVDGLGAAIGLWLVKEGPGIPSDGDRSGAYNANS